MSCIVSFIKFPTKKQAAKKIEYSDHECGSRAHSFIATASNRRVVFVEVGGDETFATKQ